MSCGRDPIDVIPVRLHEPPLLASRFEAPNGVLASNRDYRRPLRNLRGPKEQEPAKLKDGSIARGPHGATSYPWNARALFVDYQLVDARVLEGSGDLRRGEPLR